MYPYKTTVDLPSDAKIFGRGEDTGFVGPTNAPVRNAMSKTGLRLRSFRHNRGVQDGAPSIPDVRGMQFTDCTDIVYTDMHGECLADWGTSFIRCSNAIAFNYTHRAGGQGDLGGS